MANNLKKYREALGMSQYELARLSGVNRSYIAQVESGRQKLTLKMATALAPTLHQDPYAILGADAIKYDGEFPLALRSLAEANFDAVMEMRGAGKCPDRDFDLFMVVWDLTEGHLSDADLHSVKALLDSLSGASGHV